MTVLLAMLLARILLLFSRAMYMVETAATVPLATSPTGDTHTHMAVKCDQKVPKLKEKNLKKNLSTIGTAKNYKTNPIFTSKLCMKLTFRQLILSGSGSVQRLMRFHIIG